MHVGNKDWPVWSDPTDELLLLKLLKRLMLVLIERMHCGEKESWQRPCGALGNVLLGNLGSCHPCGCYFDMYHLPMHYYRSYSLMDVGSFGRIICLTTM